jgi:uncharacterized membrane protein YphA (DoxX/SURF4 family)
MVKEVLGKKFNTWCNKNCFTITKFCLGVVFLWIGALKLFGVSGTQITFASAFTLFSYQGFWLFLGLIEVIIGISLLLNAFLKQIGWVTVIYMLILFVVLIKSKLAFGTFPILTNYGEGIITCIMLGIVASYFGFCKK